MSDSEIKSKVKAGVSFGKLALTVSNKNSAESESMSESESESA